MYICPKAKECGECRHVAPHNEHVSCHITELYGCPACVPYTESSTCAKTQTEQIGQLVILPPMPSDSPCYTCKDKRSPNSNYGTDHCDCVTIKRYDAKLQVYASAKPVDIDNLASYMWKWLNDKDLLFAVDKDYIKQAIEDYLEELK